MVFSNINESMTCYGWTHAPEGKSWLLSRAVVPTRAREGSTQATQKLGHCLPGEGGLPWVVACGVRRERGCTEEILAPGEAVESPSLEIFQPHLAMVLCSLLWVTLLGQGVGLGDPQRSLPPLPC